MTHEHWAQFAVVAALFIGGMNILRAELAIEKLKRRAEELERRALSSEGRQE